MVVPKRYINASLEKYKTPTKEHTRLLELVKEPIKNNIIITGNVGTGKTFLAWSLYNDTLVEKSYGDKKFMVNEQFKITTVKDIISDIRASWKDKKHERTNFKDVPVLVIDEIGIQYGTESERIELFDIFDHRYNNELPTIALSNLKKEKITEILGKRIVDRLYAQADCFELNCESMR